ncbi:MULTISPECIES: hydroxyacylglutathione hydrolase [Paracoccus]|uniref:Hydroxyacylglutathione hydrolase n=1 Tax=Paracoccus versutus TaxID=34007 RepID=A0A3D9XHN5_PARVE|nr:MULTISPECIES: hydroxyacylglutathione hydrolase [Paracoccus]MCJ1900331.1 hydroxyacylglutathione hydrolase [Paracoccus versutus]MDF3906263.1 hydroxyacylglutathione hydrolase [Paracoccus sp. AS002]REF68593.1 hydroxyacylglutathione hydrolase [Paracoccus versutus]WGR56780.1 hydroxyacylglutathione hydrolase [Paracoccus versutus]
MPLELVPVRCLTDNYAWLVHGNGRTALVDAPEAAPILAELAARGWSLDQIALTHHHADHIQAVPELVAQTGAAVIGNAEDAARLPPLDHAVRPGERFALCGEEAEVIDVSGHTVGHVAFHLPGSAMVFTADSLMALGCGRLFEGDAAMMWASLSRLNALPAETLVCSGHDYCRGNGAFALSVDPGNAALRERLADTAAGGRPCAPSTLAEERATNPFLRVAELADSLGLAGAPEAAVFAELRARKDRF